ncbi:YicC/YloC family endoribonuclease [Alicyclobacillus sp. ALC3]|uniref:YicC/YloC family endoribonuclease n=1 Tax=Alicyclobacillus sp. ALC3 TaxID=2796143 RepID=UPI0023788A14|nr:YicC/YloC family endoribonuclease [Alicyclobacillus sp. ALC3]WDL97420.1 YicC family protein [Alicyclobacillus sp. ALC3]
MPVRSMTGFGRSTVAFDEGTVTVELRAVNHRFAEFSVRMPRDLLRLEESVRQELSTHVARGRLDVYVSVDATGAERKRVAADWGLVEALMSIEAEAKSRYPGLRDTVPVPLSVWLQQPEVLRVESGVIDPKQVESALGEAVRVAVADLIAMRTREGTRLTRDLAARVELLEGVVATIETRAPHVVSTFRDRLQKRLAEAQTSVDDSRLAAEVALMADKAAIDEELTRLTAHLQAFSEALATDSPIGRRLDFIVQELQRELNTIAAKSSDLAISQGVVEGKTIVEQLREQVQNIE